MPECRRGVTTLVRSTEEGLCLAEALFFPELLLFGDKEAALREAMQENAKVYLQDFDPAELHRRAAPAEISVREFAVEIAPPAGSALWSAPIALSLKAAAWRHGEEDWVAYIPALGVELIAPSAEELSARLPAEALYALRRSRAADSLLDLAKLAAWTGLNARQFQVSAQIRTPKQLAKKRPDEERSILLDIAVDLRAEVLAPAYEIAGVLARLKELLFGARPKSVLLVGPSGAGKTAAFHELVRRRDALGLGATPFWATSGGQMVAWATGFGMIEACAARLAKEAARTKSVVHLGNLVELMEVGKHESSEISMAQMLRPAFSRGDFIAVAECTPEQLSLIERQDPRMIDAFAQLRIEEPAQETAQAILLHRASDICAALEIGLELPELEALDRLHRRFAGACAYPGRPLRFLETFLRGRAQEKSPPPDTVSAAFSRETGLPRFMLDDAQALDLDAARAFFSGRVMGQPEAVGLVCDLLAVLKAGLNRPGKPIASLLFIGPTGVGKTETAKALAEYLFGARDRLARFDLSEYSDPLAVQRLIGGAFGREGLLTARLREQPFSVVLLDEFEKADPSLFDLLLQVLGEGRLTDGFGNLADFRNSVVILTSNLGAESFMRGVSGFSRDADAGPDSRSHFLSAIRDFLRPELFNRIDRIVTFAPLSRETALAVARRELSELPRRPGLLARKAVLSAPEGAAAKLAELGYSPRYGARPLKRAIEKEILVPLAEELSRRAGGEALAVSISARGKRLEVKVAPRGSPEQERAGAQDAARPAEFLSALRRKASSLAQGALLEGLRGEAHRLERKIELSAGRRHLAHQREGWKVQRARLSGPLERLDALLSRLAAKEELALLRCYARLGGAPAPPASAGEPEGDDGLLAVEEDWLNLLAEIHSLSFAESELVTLSLFSESKDALLRLARGYLEAAPAFSAALEASCWYVPASGEKGRLLARVKTRALGDPLGAAPEDALGVGLFLKGPAAFPRFAGEAGLHELDLPSGTFKVLAQAESCRLEEHAPPEGVWRKGAIARQPLRRRYHWSARRAHDAALDKTLTWKGELAELLKTAIAEEFARKLEAQLT